MWPLTGLGANPPMLKTCPILKPFSCSTVHIYAGTTTLIRVSALSFRHSKEEEPGPPAAAYSPTCCAGPNPLEVEVFRASLSSPAALQEKVSYELAADLVQDGLSNGTHPVYILTTPR